MTGGRHHAGCGDQRVAAGLGETSPPGRCPGPRKPVARKGGRSRPVVDTQTLGADQAMGAHEPAELEARLAETDGLRPTIQAQAQAHADLTAEGPPVIRSTVARRACAILDPHQLQGTPSSPPDGSPGGQGCAGPKSAGSRCSSTSPRS